MALRGDHQLPARRYSLSPVDTFEVERQQFEHIQDAALSVSVPFTMSVACIPVAVTLNVTLVTVTLQDHHMEAILWGLTFTCYLAGVACGIFAFLQRGQLERYMKAIRDSQVEPVAAKGLSTPSDLTAVADPDAGAALNAPHLADEVSDDDR